MGEREPPDFPMFTDDTDSNILKSQIFSSSPEQILFLSSQRHDVVLGEGLGRHKTDNTAFPCFPGAGGTKWAWPFHRLYTLLQRVGDTGAWTTRMAPESLLSSDQ